MSIEKTATGARIVRGHADSVAEYHDFMMRCGMRLVMMDEFSGYWEMDSKFIFTSYCEGDTAVIKCENIEQYKAEQNRRDDWIKKHCD